MEPSAKVGRWSGLPRGRKTLAVSILSWIISTLANCDNGLQQYLSPLSLSVSQRNPSYSPINSTSTNYFFISGESPSLVFIHASFCKRWFFFFLILLAMLCDRRGEGHSDDSGNSSSTDRNAGLSFSREFCVSTFPLTWVIFLSPEIDVFLLAFFSLNFSCWFD